MATIKYRWSVPELANVMTLFDTQKVYRSTIGPPYDWVEITTPATRVTLVAGVENYLFDDGAGDTSYYYCSAYYNTSTTEESEKADPVRGDISGYLTVDDVRAEGFVDPPYSNAQVIVAITKASRLIEKVTGQWFEPRTRTFKLDIIGSPKEGDPELSLNVPIIAVTKLEILDSDFDLNGMLIYNRHLTEGLINPDDRDNPRVMFDPNTDLRFTDIFEPLRFSKGRQNVKIEGIFGYTELDSSDPVGETSPGSQVPLSYGSTPPLIERAAMLLVARYLEPISQGGGSQFRTRNNIIEERTRDQMYKLATVSEADGSYGVTGDIEVDKILAHYTAPLAITAI